MTAVLFVWAITATFIAIVCAVAAWSCVAQQRTLVKRVLADFRVGLPEHERVRLDQMIDDHTDEDT